MPLVFGQGVFGQGVYGGTPVVVTSAPSPVFSSTGYASTIALDPGTGDLALSGLKIIRGDEAIEQKVRCVLRFFQGEWFLDRRLGMPYLQQILARKDPPIPAIKVIFKRALLLVRQIVDVRDMNLTVDNRARSGSLDFTAILDDSRTLTATAEPFILPRVIS